ncbi:MAG TPA: tetratricopeptide repeat protein [Oligoflexus sp.]|uniref:tetratricopeptide repeat protein n=1 Tax=Oligoflexus sp. TaxID=1971216 RepID=UPI002D7E9685|nr:tetratricopeptide repeat protein [Oligoflexus sp.]HET9240371.1 tetratricopeptide repeat protein [Oligoflexus sp.]
MNATIPMRWLFLTLALLPFTAQFLAAAEKPQSQKAEYTLQIPIKDAAIVRDGIIGEAVGKPNRGKIGLNEVTVTAPGYGVRRLRFWLKAGEKAVIEANLARIHDPIDPEWKSLDRIIPSAKLSKVPSVCSWYQEKTNDTAICRRKTWLEDVAFSEPTPYAVDDMRALATSKKLTGYRELVNRSTESTPELEAQVEEMFRLFPSNASVFQLNAAIALQRGDCPRVHTIFVDAQQVLPNPYPLLLYKALCFEIQGQTEAATMLIQETIKNNKAPAPYLTYHLGRMQLKKSPDTAITLANSCLKSFRFDLSCQELGLMAGRLTQKVFKVQRFNLEEGTFKIFRNLEEGLPKGLAEALFFSVIPLINSYPHSLEFYLFLAWIDSVQKVGGGLDYYARKMQVGGILASGGLDMAIETLEKQNLSYLLPAVYRARLRSDPQDPNIWLRLIRAYSKAGQCPEVIQTIKEGEGILPRYNTQLLQMQASCYVEMNRLDDALDAYLKVLTAQPKVWSTYYNLGSTYDRLKKRKEALENYKTALQYNPPAETRDNINARILELQQPAKKP